VKDQLAGTVARVGEAIRTGADRFQNEQDSDSQEGMPA
jgi:hypothetical protein